VPNSFLAEFELYVMLAVAQLGDEAFGLAVRKCIESRTGRPVSVGALYTTLARLESKGLLSMQDPDATSGRRGRPRRYCTLTEAGRHATHHSLSMLGRMAEGVQLDPAMEGVGE
jgi:DNA-binding PadR family transcriptional regulator